MDEILFREPLSLNVAWRHNRWYEKILLNPLVGHVISLILLISSAQFISYQEWVSDRSQLLTLLWLLCIYLISAYMCKHVRKYSSINVLYSSFAITSVSTSVVIAAILLLRLDYARASLSVGIMIILALLILGGLINRRFKHLKFAVVPGTDLGVMPVSSNIKYKVLTKPDLENSRYDAVVVDRGVVLDREWSSFLGQCSSKGTMVLLANNVKEHALGKLNLDELSTMDVTKFQPSSLFLLLKRIVDVIITLLLSPILIPVCIVVAILIRFDSPGPAIFVQERIGKGNRPFKMYKFRSMKVENAIGVGPLFADKDAHRITRLGALIRKYRIDELPQFLNVIKGEMSIIGPRPEQPGFVEKFESEIPFYSYRNIVMPGITGWAQVTCGYATCTDSTREKVEHDLYYIKHSSLTLDLVVTLKTIRTVMTGFGAL